MFELALIFTHVPFYLQSLHSILGANASHGIMFALNAYQMPTLNLAYGVIPADSSHCGPVSCR